MGAINMGRGRGGATIFGKGRGGGQQNVLIEVSLVVNVKMIEKV